MQSVRNRNASRLIPAVAVALSALGFAPAKALAQGIDIPAVSFGEIEEDTWANVSYAHQFESDIHTGGDITREAVMLSIGHRTEVTEDLSIVTQGTYAASIYDFSGTAQPPSVAGQFRWDDVHFGSLVGLAALKLDPNWTLLGGGLVRLHGEGSADFSDAFSGGVLLGFDFAASKDFSLGVLLGATTQLEDDIAYMIVPMLDWNFADAWKLHFGLVTAAAFPGIGPELSFRPADQWEIGVGAAYQRRRFRLDDHAPNRDGIGQEKSLPVYARVRFMPTPMTSIDLYGGATFMGELKVEEKGGDTLSDSSYDTAPIVGVRGNILF